MYHKTVITVLLLLLMGALPGRVGAAPSQQVGGQDYVVQAGDTLSALAGQFYGDPAAYPTIVEATNGKAATDNSYTLIDNPNRIAIGQKLFIPTQAEATPAPEGGAAMQEAEPAAPAVAPLPNAARGPAIPQDKGYLVEEIRDNLYWVTEGVYQIMFLTTGEGVIVVDAPPSIGENILKAIAEVTDEPITHVIYSHSHADHISAASIYPDDATYIAHEATAAQLARASDPDRALQFGAFLGGSPVPEPTVTFSDSYTLEVGDQVLELEYHGVNHEAGNIFIYAPKQKVLMVVDVIFPGWVPFKDLALAEDVPGFIQAHDEVLSYDFDIFIGGHLTRLGSRKDVETQREYILDAQANAAQALQMVDFSAVAQETGFENTWHLVETYLDRLAQACNDSTVPNWVDRLGGADVFTFSHCSRLVESLRID
jgi:glyoxylase-like metal-dependent hydrolase (beta-lactamase superfamily II)